MDMQHMGPIHIYKERFESGEYVEITIPNFNCGYLNKLYDNPITVCDTINQTSQTCSSLIRRIRYGH